MSGIETSSTGNRRHRIILACLPRIVAGTKKLTFKFWIRKWDIDLTVEDLSQYGMEEVIKAYDGLAAEDPLEFGRLSDQEIKDRLVTWGIMRMAWHIKDTFRSRYRHSIAIAPDDLLNAVDDSSRDRVNIWQRINEVWRRATERQRKSIGHLWNAAIEIDPGMSDSAPTSGEIHKATAKIRRSTRGGDVDRP